MAGDKTKTDARDRNPIDNLVFGLYGDDGLLDFVGHSRVYNDAEIAILVDSQGRAARRGRPRRRGVGPRVSEAVAKGSEAHG